MDRTPLVEWLQEHGCSVLCLGCPEGVLFGLDYSAWTVGPKFMGVKLLPPGLHYVYWSASAQDVGASRAGHFVYLQQKEVVVLRWDPADEELKPLEDPDEEMRYADGVRGFDFDQHLGPYPVQLADDWAELTRFASAKLVSRIEPALKRISSKRAEYDAAEQPAADVDPPPAEASGDAQESRGEAGMDVDVSGAEARLESNDQGGSLFFTPLPRLRQRVGASPAETTQLHLDRSPQLEEMLKRHFAGDEFSILGEMQAAYIIFLLGQNCDGFEQWKALLGLLCSCEAAVAKRPELFAELIRVLFSQLSQAPSDLFGDDLVRENFIGSCALSLLELCSGPEAPPKLQKRCGKLGELLNSKFGISLEDLALLGEDAPQVVDEAGSDLVRFDLAELD